MNSDKHTLYKNNINDILENSLFSYPFYDKSDQQLIIDAKNRTDKSIVFGLFELRECESKSVIAGNGAVDTKYLPLKSTASLSETIIQIKVSSFVYPAYFMTSMFDKKHSLRSTFNYEHFDDYYSILNYSKEYIGQVVLVTSCWDLMSGFGNFVKCVNIMSTPQNDSALANLIRECFLNERIKFLDEFVENPEKFMPNINVDKFILNEVLIEYQPKFKSELNRLKNL